MNPAAVVVDRADSAGRAIVHGIPLDGEPGIGALSIPGYLREVCQRHGPREAVVMHGPAGVERWTYDDLWEHSVAVAAALIDRGIGKGSRVGILMTNRPEYLAALFGTALAGGISVALSTFSTPPELAQLLAASDVSLLLFERQVLKTDFAAMLAELEPGLLSDTPGALSSVRFPYLRHLVQLESVSALGAPAEIALTACESWMAFVARAQHVDRAVVAARADSVAPADPGGLFFSSGTTSLPKGILHSQRAFAIQWWRWPRVLAVARGTRAWTGNGFFWSGNVSMVVGVALSTGGAVVLDPLFNPASALRLIETERVTFINGRPHQWARLQAEPGFAAADLGSLRYIPRGELLKAHPAVDIDWEVPMSFGTTETMTIITSYDADTPAGKYAGSCGVPLPGNTLKIIDPYSGTVRGIGERGEICIKGPTLMLGYIGKTPEECFDADGYFHTGDGGYVDDEGRLFWEGRLGDMIKTGGANVSPEEVDAAIAKLPGVKRARTVGVPDELLGEIVVSCIVPLEGVALDERAIIDALKGTLASFKIPRRVLFFNEGEIALTANEKVKTGELRELAVKRLSRAGGTADSE